MMKQKNIAFVDGILISARKNVTETKFMPNIAPSSELLKELCLKSFSRMLWLKKMKKLGQPILETVLLYEEVTSYICGT